MTAETNIAVVHGQSCQIIAKPATHTRRMRVISDGIGGVGQGSDKPTVYMYVGANPVMKKTTRMLRKRANEPEIPKKGQRRQEKQPAKIPRRASQETITKKNIAGHISRSSSRSRISPTTSNLSIVSSSMPKTPRRKASNPFLRDGLVGQTITSSTQLTNQLELDHCNWKPRSPVLTRSRSKQAIHVLQSSSNGGAQPPRLPHREASIPDALSNARWTISRSGSTSTNSQNNQAQPATNSLYQMSRTANNNNTKASFMDLEWAKMSISESKSDTTPSANSSHNSGQCRFLFEPPVVPKARTERAPRAPRRKASSMDLDDI